MLTDSFSVSSSEIWLAGLKEKCHAAGTDALINEFIPYWYLL